MAETVEFDPNAPVYDRPCIYCGSGCRVIDRFCSQCGQPDPLGANDEMLRSRTITMDEDELIDAAPTFVAGEQNPTEGTILMPDGTVIKTRPSHLVRKAAETAAALQKMLTPGNVFGRRYRISRFLGAGSMGYVCSAVDESIDEQVALKILSSPIHDDPDSFDRFKMELKLARRIRHRNVVQSFDLGFADGFPYISMEYIDADNLSKHLKRRETFEEIEALTIIRQVLRGLRAAHNLGIIHRDIKPENILLNKDKMAFITDFGIATSSDLARRRELAGTPDYMAPEQLRCEEVTPASDLYSTGVVFYRMLTGTLPYRADSVTGILDAHLNAEPDPIPEELPVSAVTRELVSWLLQKRITSRPQTAAQVIDMIEPLLKSVTARSASGRLTVLVVDHDLATLAFLRGVLEADGYRVTVAENARDGIDVAFEQTPAVILLDARIRGGFDVDIDVDLGAAANSEAVDALGFLRIIREDQKLKDVPVVIMSDKTISGLDPAFWKSGAAELVLKPLAAADVMDAVRKVFPPRARPEGGAQRAEGRA